jgi:hypothetical protein
MKCAPRRYVLAGLGALAMIGVSSVVAASASQLVQVADLILSIPDKGRVVFDPESANRKPRVDYRSY